MTSTAIFIFIFVLLYTPPTETQKTPPLRRRCLPPPKALAASRAKSNWAKDRARVGWNFDDALVAGRWRIIITHGTDARASCGMKLDGGPAQPSWQKPRRRLRQHLLSNANKGRHREASLARDEEACSVQFGGAAGELQRQGCDTLTRGALAGGLHRRRWDGTTRNALAGRACVDEGRA